MNTILSLIAVVFAATATKVVHASAGTCDDTSLLISASGGWYNEDTGLFLRGDGSANVACTGPCLPFTDSDPYIVTPPEGQSILEPTESWFSSPSYEPHYCMTDENYANTGPNKKRWAYCVCAKLCEDINNQENCNAGTFYTPSPSPCVWGNGQCGNAPDCEEANDFYGSNLNTKCRADPECTFASGTCHFTPTTCAGVNSIYQSSGNNKKASCLSTAEGCFYKGGVCYSIPTTCAGVEGLVEESVLSSDSDRFEEVCETSAEGCYAYQGNCNALPPGCAGVNNDEAISEINRDGARFQRICEAVSGCAVYDSSCQRTPDTCDEVNGEFTQQSTISSACNSVSSENCAVVAGECAQVGCNHYHQTLTGVPKQNACNAASGCVLSRGRCCDETSQCFNYETGAECKADSDCSWKGPNGRKSCVCAFDTSAARRL